MEKKKERKYQLCYDCMVGMFLNQFFGEVKFVNQLLLVNDGFLLELVEVIWG